jgi:hypothetical protein
MGLPRRFAPRNDRKMDSRVHGNDRERDGADESSLKRQARRLSYELIAKKEEINGKRKAE